MRQKHSTCWMDHLFCSLPSSHISINTGGGRTLDVPFHKNWASICRYLLKQDGQPLVWGEFSLEEIRDIAAGTSSKSATNAGASPKSATKVRASTPALPSNSNSWRRLRLTSSSRSSNDVEIGTKSMTIPSYGV